VFHKNTRYKIKTPTGFENFKGVLKKTTNKMYCITFEDDSYIKCSDGHGFLTDKGFLKASELTLTNTLTGKKIKNINFETGNFDVYDPVGVDRHNTYYSNDIISHNTEFLGSSNILISSAKMKQLIVLQEDPSFKDGKLDIFEKPIENNTYTITVDVAEGLGQDYSTFSVIDVTQIPYKLVAKFRDNTITPLLFPTKILQTARYYNEAFILVEINSIGLQVADIIHFEFGYENLIKIETKGKQGQLQSPGFKKRIAYGIKTSKQTKAIGCANLKTLIESDKLIVKDPDIIKEFTTFAVDKQTYKAEDGSNDDLVMTLVHFGWLTSQRYFKENINSDIRKAIQKEQMNLLDSDVVPFGIIDNGIDDPFKEKRLKDAELWVDSRYDFSLENSINLDTLSNRWKL